MVQPFLISFTFYWKDGSKETLWGTDVPDALNREGYRLGYLKNAAQIVTNETEPNFKWDSDREEWIPIKGENPQ